jgi:hypothetical protein
MKEDSNIYLANSQMEVIHHDDIKYFDSETTKKDIEENKK